MCNERTYNSSGSRKTTSQTIAGTLVEWWLDTLARCSAHPQALMRSFNDLQCRRSIARWSCGIRLLVCCAGRWFTSRSENRHRAATHICGRINNTDIVSRPVCSGPRPRACRRCTGRPDRLPLARQPRCNEKPDKLHLAGQAVCQDFGGLAVLGDEAASVDFAHGRGEGRAEAPAWPGSFRARTPAAAPPKPCPAHPSIRSRLLLAFG
jgi:hypothetical protein